MHASLPLHQPQSMSLPIDRPFEILMRRQAGRIARPIDDCFVVRQHLDPVASHLANNTSRLPVDQVFLFCDGRIPRIRRAGAVEQPQPEQKQAATTNPLHARVPQIKNELRTAGPGKLIVISLVEKRSTSILHGGLNSTCSKNRLRNRTTPNFYCYRISRFVL